jgi:hypothetical protein
MRETIMFGATPYKEWVGATAWRQIKDGRLRALSIRSGSLHDPLSTALVSQPAANCNGMDAPTHDGIDVPEWKYQQPLN